MTVKIVPSDQGRSDGTTFDVPPRFDAPLQVHSVTTGNPVNGNRTATIKLVAVARPHCGVGFARVDEQFRKGMRSFKRWTPRQALKTAKEAKDAASTNAATHDAPGAFEGAKQASQDIPATVFVSDLPKGS